MRWVIFLFLEYPVLYISNWRSNHRVRLATSRLLWAKPSDARQRARNVQTQRKGKIILERAFRKSTIGCNSFETTLLINSEEKNSVWQWGYFIARLIIWFCPRTGWRTRITHRRGKLKSHQRSRFLTTRYQLQKTIMPSVRYVYITLYSHVGNIGIYWEIC